MLVKKKINPTKQRLNLFRFEWQQKRYPERVFKKNGVDKALFVSDFMEYEFWVKLLVQYKKRYKRTIKSDRFGYAKRSQLDNKINSLKIFKSYREYQEDSNSYNINFNLKYKGNSYE